MPHASYAKVDKDVNVAKVQAMLAELCYEPGIVDGAWGKKTETAVKAFFAKLWQKMLHGNSSTTKVVRSQ